MKILSSGRLRSFSLLATDIISLFTAIFSVFFVMDFFADSRLIGIIWRTWPIFVLMISFNMSGRLYCGNLFYPGQVIHPVEEFRRLTLGCAGSFIIFSAILSLAGNDFELTKTTLGSSMIISLVMLPVGRIILRYLLWKANIAYIPAVITGDSDLAASIIKRMRSDDFNILSIKASCCGKKIADDIPDLTEDELINFTGKNGINYMIFCNKDNMKIDDFDELVSKYLHILVVNNVSGFPVLWSYPVSFYRFFSFEVSNRLMRKNVLIQKRIIEIIFAAFALFIIAIPGVFLAVLVKLTSRGPIFYRSQRLGKNGRPIEVLKFRTMRENADSELEQIFSENPELRTEWENKFKLENDPRVTPVGKFLRKTSLDELPQFWNVIKGEMALIGPRPIIEKEKKYYGKNYATFSSVKPGITGLWQVSGRSDTGYEERVALDVFYVNNWSLWMDYYIFFATINAVILRRGAK